MNRAIVFVNVLASLLAAGNASAQGFCGSVGGDGDAAVNLWEKFTKRVEIRQNTNVKRDIAQPVFVTFTNPDEGLTTYQIGVGALASICPGTGFDLDALLDYQRNTAINDEQDSFKTGLTGYWRPGDLAVNLHAPLVSFRTNFKNDGVKDNQGWQNAIGYTHLFAGQHRFLPNLPFRFGEGGGERSAALEVVYFPFVGLEFDSVLKAPSREAQGTATRGLAQLNVAFYPAPLKTRSPLELLLGYAYRSDFDDTTNQTDDSHPLFTFETNYFPIQHPKRGEIGFGVSYTNGEDPDEGFDQQAFWMLSLKFRLKKR